jgi:hypothetical protein
MALRGSEKQLAAMHSRQGTLVAGPACMASKRSSSSRAKSGRKKAKRTRKTGRRKYGAKASKKVERSMHEAKRGTLRSGRSKKKVTSRKQAIAIGLSEARRAGGKVPSKKKTRKRKTGMRRAA